MKEVEFFFCFFFQSKIQCFHNCIKVPKFGIFPAAGKTEKKKKENKIRLNFAFHNVSKHNKCSLYVKFAPMIDTVFLFTKIYLYIEDL